METDGVSDKSYGTAVILCGIFGILGVHHFYLENFIHGIIDFGMLVGAVLLFAFGFPLLGFALLAADIIHSAAVFYLLITEQAHDGQGNAIRISSK
ncbi:MAG: TM2 domain-containing membrane protein YozV [Halocynthiibacter sp.]